MIAEICAEIKNYFCTEKQFDTFEISGGVLPPLSFLKDGQYFRIVGSALNDGVYKYPMTCLNDEKFDGAIWVMNVPPAFIKLCEEIKAYAEKDVASPYVSESFGGYSYTKASINGKPASWQTVFSKRLNNWRKINEFT